MSELRVTLREMKAAGQSMVRNAARTADLHSTTVRLAQWDALYDAITGGLGHQAAAELGYLRTEAPADFGLGQQHYRMRIEPLGHGRIECNWVLGPYGRWVLQAIGHWPEDSTAGMMSYFAVYGKQGQRYCCTLAGALALAGADAPLAPWSDGEWDQETF